jgi:hypothetical protein
LLHTQTTKKIKIKKPLPDCTPVNLPYINHAQPTPMIPTRPPRSRSLPLLSIRCASPREPASCIRWRANTQPTSSNYIRYAKQTRCFLCPVYSAEHQM